MWRWCCYEIFADLMNYVNAGPLTLVSAGLWFAAWLWAAAAFGSFFVGRAFRSTSPKGVWLDASVSDRHLRFS